MKKLFGFLMAPALAALSLSLVLFSCENQLDTTGEDSTVPVPDPEGTVTVSLRNENSGGTSVDGIRIDEADNFSGAYFVSLGSMKGLGNVTRIPSSGWNEKAAVIPGTGYVAYNNGEFYRLYVDSYTLNASNEIIGATIKYQHPFSPDETIKLPLTSLRFAASGGNQNIMFENTDIIPFEISLKGGDDILRVDKSSTLEYSFLSNGIVISASPNTSVTRDCIVTITDYNGNSQDISITIDGEEPYLDLSQDTITLPYSLASRFHVVLNTNYNLSDLTVSSSDNWCTPSLSYEYDEILSRMNASIRYRGKTEVTDGYTYTGASVPVFILLDAEANEAGRSRTATVTVKSLDSRASASLGVIQQPFDVSVQFERTQSSKVVTLSGLTQDICSVSSDADWCTFNWGGESQLVIRALANETGADRKAEITISSNGISKTIPVYQSRYALLDAYSENGIVGTVCILTEQNHGKIYSLIEGTYAWSTEAIPTGATSRDDGEYNTDRIRQIQGYETPYPAFAAVLAKNTGSISGWYMPAIDELLGLDENVVEYIRQGVNHSTREIWSSTEWGSNGVLCMDYRGYEANENKEYECYVIAFHKF